MTTRESFEFSSDHPAINVTNNRITTVVCMHKKLQYCLKCDTVRCADCGEEWVKPVPVTTSVNDNIFVNYDYNSTQQ